MLFGKAIFVLCLKGRHAKCLDVSFNLHDRFVSKWCDNFYLK